ncbi:unnamed protein product, partial [Iphiclides podalirius]
MDRYEACAHSGKLSKDRGVGFTARASWQRSPKGGATPSALVGARFLRHAPLQHSPDSRLFTRPAAGT